MASVLPFHNSLSLFASPPASTRHTAVPTFVYFCILYICAKTLEASFKRFSVVYPTLTFANQRTCVIYILNTAATTAAFALQMAASPTLASDFSKLGFEYIRICCVLISGLYLFELIYRESLRWPMILHHFSTLAAIFLVRVCSRPSSEHRQQATAAQKAIISTVDRGLGSDHASIDSRERPAMAVSGNHRTVSLLRSVHV